MSSTTEFEFDKNGGCQYTIGQELPEFAPMNYEAKFSFNEKSLDIIVGLAPSRSGYFNSGWLHVNLFFYRCIPSLIVTTGYIQVAGNIILKGNKDIDIKEWLNQTDDYVNLVLVDVCEDYEVKEIRRVKLPLMKAIREVLRNQAECSEGEVDNTLGIIEDGFQIPWMINYTDEQCNYNSETAEDIQSGEHIINEPKEKKVHIYY